MKARIAPSCLFIIVGLTDSSDRIVHHKSLRQACRVDSSIQKVMLDPSTPGFPRGGRLIFFAVAGRCGRKSLVQDPGQLIRGLQGPKMLLVSRKWKQAWDSRSQCSRSSAIIVIVRPVPCKSDGAEGPGESPGPSRPERFRPGTSELGPLIAVPGVAPGDSARAPME